MKQLFFTCILLSAFTLSSFAQNSFTKVIAKDRVIPSYCIEVTFDKTTHLIFPSGISYIDLGSSNIIAGKADGAENVVRVKAAVRAFKKETNFSVITDEGSFYSFIVNYSENPDKLNMEIADSRHKAERGNKTAKLMDIYLSGLGGESPKSVQQVMKNIYKANRKNIGEIKSSKFGIRFRLLGIYSYNGLLFLHTEIKNNSNIPFNIDFISFKIVDRKVLKRTAVQETVIKPVRAYNEVASIQEKDVEKTVLAFENFTIPDKKQLIVELFEKNGGRHQEFIVKGRDLSKARLIKY